jgi:hypothetical protein
VNETPRLRRRLWPWILGCIALVWAGLTAPSVWSSFVFGSLVGLTPAEVRAKCGEPQFASVPGAASIPDSEFYPPVWGLMSQATRDRLMAQPEFMFGYQRWLGDQWSVRFKNGKVVRIDHSSK